MSPEDFHRFTDRVVEWARTEPHVLGIVALGSTAGVSRRPDEWSDHDLFVIAERDAAVRLRNDVSWLPDPDRLVLVHHETEHGRGAVYDDGHLVEVAVFTEIELDLARVNDYAVLLDRCELGARMADLAARTAAETRSTNKNNEIWRVGALVKELIVGVSRYARGERISANERVRCNAMGHLVTLIHDRVPAVDADQADNLDPTRRLERTHPALAGRLASAMDGPLPTLVAEIVSIVQDDILRGRDDHSRALNAVRAMLDRSDSASGPVG